MKQQVECPDNTRYRKQKQEYYGSGNPNYGKKHPGLNHAETNPMWKGNKPIHRTSLHEWVRNHLPEPELCQICNEKPPRDLANISGKYLRDVTDWQYLCRRCHMISDGRINNLKQFQKENDK